MSRKILSYLLLAGLLSASQAAFAASPDLDLKRARDRFEYGDYADAARLSKTLIDEGKLTSEAQLVEAYRVLGLSLFYQDQKDDARSAFVSLLSIEPDYRLDPFFHPPRVMEFFDEVKAQNEALLAPIREQKKRIAEEKRRQEEARQRLLQQEARRREARAKDDAAQPQVVERTISNHEYLVNWVPFGAGQFQNGETFKGGALAAGEAVTGLASIVGFVVVANLQRCEAVSVPPGSIGEAEQTSIQCGIPPESANLASNMDRVKWVAGGLFWGLVVYGIIDAHLHYQPFTVVGERRIDAPEKGGSKTAAEPVHSAPQSRLEPRLRFSPYAGPGGAGAFLTLQF